MKTISKLIFSTLLLMAGAMQGAWAQTTVTTADKLSEAVASSQTVTLGADITTASQGGRLDINNGKTVTIDLNGHTLTRQMTAADDGGQVIFVANGGSLTIKDSSTGGKITGGWAYQGGGIYVQEGGSLTITGGAITGNRADQKNGYYGFGGGVEVQSGGTMTMTGGTITGNTAGGAGNGVYQNQNVTFNIQGNPVVDELYLTEYSFVTLTGALTSGASIGLNAQKVDQTHLTLNYPNYHSGTAAETFFTSKNNFYTVCLRPDGEVVYGAKYIERAWNADSKSVTQEIKACANYTAINGNDTSDKGWLQLDNGWYVVTGNSAYKVLNIQGNDVHLIIPDDVTLTTTHVKLETGKKLTIYGQGNDTGKLVADNKDVFNKAAGIGGGDGTSCGTLIIHGGTITAQGGEFGAGIGSGNNSTYMAGHVNIYGGNVTAKGGLFGAGIGGGDYGDGAVVRIYGGTIDAKAYNSDNAHGAGIGGGRYANGIETYIYGGTVNARGSFEKGGAAIGGGNGLNHSGKGNGGHIEIHGGTVNASTYCNGAAIGCGYKGESAIIVITGGTIEAEAATAAAIGGGCGYNPTLHITISGGTITATSDQHGIGAGCGLFGGEYDYKGTLNITGGTIYAYGQKRAIGGANYNTVASSMALYNEAMVHHALNPSSNKTKSTANDRAMDCVTHRYVVIEPCDHSGATYTVSGITSTDTHTKHCNYCATAFSPETHTFSEGKCTVCGVEQNTFTVTVNIPANNGATDGVYEARTYQMVPGTKFKLPASPVTFSDRVFAGWILGEVTNGTYRETYGDDLHAEGEEYTITEDVTFSARYRYVYIHLADNADNSEALYKYTGITATLVNLVGRTLYKDGSWNTLCLPFSLSSFDGTPLAGATVKTLSSASFADGTLTLNFSDDLTSIEAGKPYIVKWAAAADVKDPAFGRVTISATLSDVETEAVTFKGVFSPCSFSGEDKSVLYLGADNKLYYPNAAMTIGSCRAYFQLNGLTAGELAAGVKAIQLNFGDGETTAIDLIPSDKDADGSWYTIDGRALNAQPTLRGLYIHNGRKVMVK